jgi:hypothetical protein
MLISMPTGTSTIFGVFQDMWVSQAVWYDSRTGAERKAVTRAMQGLARKSILSQQTQQRDLLARAVLFPALQIAIDFLSSGFGWRRKLRCCYQALTRHSKRPA